MNGAICKTNKNVTRNVSITLLLTPSLFHSAFHFSLRPSFPAVPLAVFPKYVPFYHMWRGRMSLSQAGNDFFVLISVLRGIRVVLVIRSFITLPAHHSAVWVNAISPDSHNYPKMERGREISLPFWVRESLTKHTEKGREATRVIIQPGRRLLSVHGGCLFAGSIYNRNGCQRH